MFILGEFFNSLAFLIDGVCQLLYWLLFARIVVSWLPVDPYHSIVQFLHQVTEPLLAPFRRIPIQLGMFDMAPLFAFTALYFINRVLVRILLTFAFQFGGAH